MNKWKFFTTKEIKPRGWLRSQLRVQADGLAGNLDKVWRDVRDSAWIGGSADGWERVPYWLDGFIPLAYLLEDEDMIARARRYVESIISYQQEDGWICPCKDEDRATYDTWAILLISKTLTVYYDSTGDERIPGVIYRTMKNYYDLLKSEKIKLFDWGKYRWFEGFAAIGLLHKLYFDEWIVDLARILREQGARYDTFTDGWKHPLNLWQWHTHIVNLGMMFKYEAVSCDILGEEYTDVAERLHEVLKKYNGTPVETFTGDECLGGVSPIRGTELCGVVEQMFSYELLFAYTGDRRWAERLEVLAFNALPATISDDMWTHQYDQMSNQIACQRFPGKSLFGTNDCGAHIFGLEPNYGCCTANFGQGWPKFTLAAYMHSEETVINAIPVPSALDCELMRVELTTDYPFKNTFEYSVEAKRDAEFIIRIPSFAKDLKVNGLVTPTDDIALKLTAGEVKNVTVSFEVEPTFEDRKGGLWNVRCGSLIYALPIAYEKKMLEYEKNGVERKFPYCDYELRPVSDWNYAYCDDVLDVEEREISDIPFSSEAPPTVIRARVCHIDWGFEEGYDTVCARYPESREPLGDAETVKLYPYGCTRLRMTEMPKI